MQGFGKIDVASSCDVMNCFMVDLTTQNINRSLYYSKLVVGILVTNNEIRIGI